MCAAFRIAWGWQCTATLQVTAALAAGGQHAHQLSCHWGAHHAGSSCMPICRAHFPMCRAHSPVSCSPPLPCLPPCPSPCHQVTVPTNWECQGFGRPQYTNFVYPFPGELGWVWGQLRGHESHNCMQHVAEALRCARGCHVVSQAGMPECRKAWHANFMAICMHAQGRMPCARHAMVWDDAA